MADEHPPVLGSVRPTVLVVGDDEPMDEAICAALDRNGLDVERVPTLEAVDATRLAAPDLVLLVGDAARSGGETVLARLAENPLTQVVPVALLSDDAALGERLLAFRHGAVAVVPRSASVDEMARKVAAVAREMPERKGEQTGELGEATFDELMKLVTQELRSGILSVEAGGKAGNTEGSTAFRLVLGAGKPVAKAVEAFVAQLRPLVSKAEPLRYELLETAGARFGLLDEETGGATEGEADLAALRGLRVLLVVLDPVRADALASELRARGATVAVADASGRGLERARGLDPEVVIIDAAGIEGAGFAVIKACRRDPRLRWASMLVAKWEELWPEGAGSPDMPRLASRLAPLIEPDRTIAERARTETSFDTRLELIGPSRLLRALARVEPTLHITVRNPRCVVDVDLSQGLVVGAVAKREGAAADAPPLEGQAALAALLALGSGRVRVERRINPQSANVMAPVEEALSRAAGEEPPLTPSVPPPSLLGGIGLGAADSAPPPAAAQAPAAAPVAPATAVEPPAPLSPAVPSLAMTAPPVPRALRNAFDEAPTNTRAPLPGAAKRTLVGLPSPLARTAPSKTAPPRPKTMMGLAPALSSLPAPVATPAVLGFVPASSPPSADAASSVAEEESQPLPPPARVPKEATHAALTSPTQTTPAPARPRSATIMGSPAVSATHLAASGPTTQAPTMTSTMPGPPTASIPAPEPIANVILFGEPLEGSTTQTDAFVIPDAGVTFGAPPTVAAVVRPRRSMGLMLGLGAVAIVLFAVTVTAAALVLPRLFASVAPVGVGVPPVGVPPIAPVTPVAIPGVPVVGVPPVAVPVVAVLPTALVDAGALAALPPTHVIPTPAVPTPVIPTPEVPTPVVPTPEVLIVAVPEPPSNPAVDEPGSRPDTDVSSGDRLVVRANRVLAAGDMRQAEMIYLEALRAESRNPHALAGLARLHLARRAGRQALSYAEQAVAVRPRRSAYRIILGDALTLLGRRPDAQRAYREALRLDPHSREARSRVPR